ncbi:MAG: alanine dehydrogenase [Acidobacteria bacterium]|nr:alanine dehydrogenase [Acidobacteriota bacterium]
MIIGVPKEIKDHEYRVGLVPGGVHVLRASGHEVLVEVDAGEGSGISNDEYRTAGARIVDDPSQIWARSDMIVKVKEPIEPEYPRLREDQVLFTYLHLAPNAPLTRRLLEAKTIGVAYETIRERDGSLPLLIPMSEVAGRMAIQVGAYYLQKTSGGRGELLGGVPGVTPAHVVILGGGTVGTNATKMAVGLGARVTILDRDLNRLRYLDDIFGGRVRTLMSNAYTIEDSVKKADLLIGAVLIMGAAAPKLVTRDMIRAMRKASVAVDVAVDQGGCFETTHPTTHSSPTYSVEGVLHYCVSNMPAAVPRTSTFALTNVTLSYAVKLASRKLQEVTRDDPVLRSGVNTYRGKVSCQPVAEAQNLDYVPIEQLW